MKDQLIKRLYNYARINTQSDGKNESCPSSEGQLTLVRMLAEELLLMGMEDIHIDGNGYLMATLPANTNKSLATIGFIAHLDTAGECSGFDVKPQIIDSFDGNDLVLNKERNIRLSPRQFPELNNYIGHTLITTDGTTLLGADNKAGIAEIVTAMEYLLQHPEIEHGMVRIAFTPDEEIGRGAHRFDVAAFGAKWAYTIDGGPVGELSYENFNAGTVRIICRGLNVHPGSAKGKLVNSAKLAMELHSRLPILDTPELTDGYEGFYHLFSIHGDTEMTTCLYLIRDFDRTAYEQRKQHLIAMVADLQLVYGPDNISIEIKDSYYNMRQQIEPVMEIVDIARNAMEKLGIKPQITPIRGGTDGARLSYMGLPTPNIFTGGENFHSPFEYISADNMVLASKVIVEMISSLACQNGAADAKTTT